MTNTDRPAEKPDASKTKETILEQEELSAEELSKIAGGDVYKAPLPQKGFV